MLFSSFWPGPWRAVGALAVALLALPQLAWCQAPVITAVTPVPGIRNAARTSPVRVSFDQAMAAGAGAALRVFSAQRGGLRSAGGGGTAVSGNVVAFAPTYPYVPGETVQATVTTAATAAAGGRLAAARVVQFTAAAAGGSGIFGGGATIASAQQCLGVALADVDGDGDLDLLAANPNLNAVSVRLNDGAGNFVTPANRPDPTLNGSPYDVALADVDGDGDLDLLATNINFNGPGSVSVRLNDGTGRFAAPATGPEIAVGREPASIAVGDVDGDGDLDFITANSAANTASVRLNDGVGRFAAPTAAANVAVGPSPVGVALADVDADGDLDALVTFGTASGAVGVRLNDGAGRFAAPAASPNVAVGPYPTSIAVGDVDGDGDLDFVTANFAASGTASVRLNDGRGRFGAPALNPDPAVGPSPYGVALADVDGDGDLDFITANANASGTASVRLNDGSGRFGGGSDPAVGSAPSSLAVGDVDGDGDLDFVTADYSSYSVSVRLNRDYPFPIITGLSPTLGPVGTSVVLTGLYLGGATAVYFGGTPALGFVVNSPTRITVAVPGGAATGSVVVSTVTGNSNALPFTVTGPTAAPGPALAAAVALFPNPVRGGGAVRLRVPAVAGAAHATATLLNALGQVVQVRTAALPASGATLTLDATALPPGVYALRLTAGPATVTKRLVVE